VEALERLVSSAKRYGLIGTRMVVAEDVEALIAQARAK
jgi:hypothetical protein